MSNSIEKLAKEAERLAKSLQGNPFSAFDRIAKDIRERQDNAIAMEFTKCIGELLRKNGVVPKISEYRMENHAENHTENKIEMRYGVTIDELDFSEHDKVFEDKIELLNRNLNLQKDKRCEAEIERNYLAERINQLKGENEELKQKISDLESLMKKRDEFLEMKNIQIEELKQRIAELESKKNIIEVRVPASPIEIATYLINNTCTINELKMIAEHINVYCNGGK